MLPLSCFPRRTAPLRTNQKAPRAPPSQRRRRPQPSHRRRSATIRVGYRFPNCSLGPLEGLDDSLVLAIAAEQNRVLVSHDQNTMELHFRDFVSEGNSPGNSPGLILVPQRIPIGVAIEGLHLIWEALEPADLTNRVCYPASCLCAVSRCKRLRNHRAGFILNTPQLIFPQKALGINFVDIFGA